MSKVEIRYNIHSGLSSTRDVNLESHYLEDSRKTFTQKVNNMKLIKDLGIIAEKNGHKVRWGLYECSDCGVHYQVRTSEAKTRTTSTCKTCSNKIRHRKHGDWGTQLYGSWQAMNGRCGTHKNYKNVTIYEDWRLYIGFKEWALNNGYKAGLSIDRIDPNGNYEPNNCRWANKSIQSQNRRRQKSETGYAGIRPNSNGKRFSAKIYVDNKNIYIGTYDSKIEAAKTRDAYVIENNLYHTLNFPKDKQWHK